MVLNIKSSQSSTREDCKWDDEVRLDVEDQQIPREQTQPMLKDAAAFKDSLPTPKGILAMGAMIDRLLNGGTCQESYLICQLEVSNEYDGALPDYQVANAKFPSHHHPEFLCCQPMLNNSPSWDDETIETTESIHHQRRYQKMKVRLEREQKQKNKQQQQQQQQVMVVDAVETKPATSSVPKWKPTGILKKKKKQEELQPQDLSSPPPRGRSMRRRFIDRGLVFFSSRKTKKSSSPVLEEYTAPNAQPPSSPIEEEEEKVDEETMKNEATLYDKKEHEENQPGDDSSASIDWRYAQIIITKSQSLAGESAAPSICLTENDEEDEKYQSDEEQSLDRMVQDVLLDFSKTSVPNKTVVSCGSTASASLPSKPVEEAMDIKLKISHQNEFELEYFPAESFQV